MLDSSLTTTSAGRYRWCVSHWRREWSGVQCVSQFAQYRRGVGAERSDVDQFTVRRTYHARHVGIGEERHGITSTDEHEGVDVLELGGGELSDVNESFRSRHARAAFHDRRKGFDHELRGRGGGDSLGEVQL